MTTDDDGDVTGPLPRVETAPDPEVERIAYEHHGLPSDCIECPVVGESGECPRLVAFRRAVEAGRNYGWFKFNDEVVSPDPEVEALVTQALHDIHDIEDPDWPDTIRRAVEAGRAPLLKRIEAWKAAGDAQTIEAVRAEAHAAGAREAYEACLAIARIRFERGARRLSAASIESRIRGRARGGGR